MKFTNGYWMIRDGVDALYAREAYELAADATTESLNVLAPTSVVRGSVTRMRADRSPWAIRAATLSIWRSERNER